jgi:hypothetical protein
MVSSAAAKPLTQIATRDFFQMPRVKSQPVYTGPILQRIQYDRPLAQVKEVMQALGVRSFVKAGEKTFDYFYNAEVGE